MSCPNEIEGVGQCVMQFVGREIRILDYIEAVGQEIGYYIAELRKRKYDQALLVLPHDGNAHHGPIHKTYKTHFEDAGFEVEVIPNQGPGAAMMRIEALRRVFPRCWFNETTTEAGREALGFYHERRDETRNIGLGPEHDWSSHAADAAGLMAIVYEEPPVKSAAIWRPSPPRIGSVV
jgi:phage terminase large subunit